MPITVQQFRKVLDDMEIAHMIHKDSHVIEFIVHDSDPIPLDYKILFSISEEKDRIQATGILCSKDVDDSDDFKSAYLFCNQWHADTTMPKVILNCEGKLLACEWTWNRVPEISDDDLSTLIVNFVHGTQVCISKAIEAGVYLIDDTPKSGPKGLLARVSDAFSFGDDEDDKD